MRKKGLLVAMLALFSMGIIGLGACTTPNSDSSSGLIEEQTTFISGFDSYEELVSFRWRNHFGAAELTTEYCTEGNYAAKLTVRGLHTDTSKPMISMPTGTDWIPRTDYMDVASILVDVYNANETEQTIGFQYLTLYEEISVPAAEILETIPAKTQKTIEFKPDRSFMAKFLNLDAVSALRLTFENQKTYTEPNRIFYVDNMRLKTTEEPIDSNIKVREDDEFESCDRAEYLAVWGNMTKKVYSNSTLSFNDNPEYIKSGKGSFRLTSNYNGGSTTVNHSVGIKLLKPIIADIRDYYSFSFWVYNDNEVNIPFWWGFNLIKTLPAKQWTQIEMTLDWFKTNTSTNLQEFKPTLTFHVGLDKPYTLYIDDIRVNKIAQNLVAPTLNVVDNTSEQKLDISWENKGAASYSYKVLVNGEEQVAETNIGTQTTLSVPYSAYILDAKTVDVLVTAYGNSDAKKIATYTKFVFDFDSVPENFTMALGTTDNIPLATASEGEITWKVEDIRAITTGMDANKLYSTQENVASITMPNDKDRILRITWTLTVDGFSRNAYTYILPQMDGLMPLTNEYEDFFESASYTGDVKKSDFEIIDGQKTFRLHNGTGIAQGTFSNPEYLGEHMSYYDYFVYNNSNSDVRVTITSSDNTFIVPANSLYKMNYIYWVNAGAASWNTWRVVTADGRVNDMVITATAQGENATPIDLYFGYFRVNKNAFDFGPIYVMGETSEAEKVTVSWKPVYGAIKYTYEVVVNGNAVTESIDLGMKREVVFDYSTYAEDIVDLKIIVKAYNAEDEIVVDTFKKSFLAFTYLPESIYIPSGVSMPIPSFAIAEKGELTWEIEYFRYRLTTDGGFVGVVERTVNEPLAIGLDGSHQIGRIKWTICYGEFTLSAYTYYIPDTGLNGNKRISLSELDDDYFSGGTVSGDVTVSNEEILEGESSWLHISSNSNTASGTFTGDGKIYLGDNRTYFDMLIYNPTDFNISLNINGASYTISSNSFMLFDPMYWGYSSAVVGWGLVNNAGYINSFTISATTSGGAVDLYIGAIAINSDAFELGELVISGNTADNQLMVQFNEVANAISYTYTVKINGNDIDDYVNKEIKVQTEGMYSITYDYTDVLDDLNSLEIIVTAEDSNGKTVSETWEKLFNVNPLTIPDFIVSVPTGKDPVILQLTDTQIVDAAQKRTENRLGPYLDGFWATDQIEERCYDYLTETITATSPDLIIITGDLIYGEFDDNGTVLESFVSFMDSFEIPWAPVFGNHENESEKGVDWQCEQFEKAEYCLFKQRELTGNGNYSVGIEQDGKLIRVFYMLDSNGCGAASAESLENGHTVKSTGFGDDQIAWYTKQIQDIQDVSPETKFSFAFHIQLSVFADAYAKYGFDNSTTKTHPINIDYAYDKKNSDFGYLGANLKGAWDSNKAVYEGLKSLGVDSIFVGHEHCNSASVMYEGIRFQFGQKSSEYDRFNCVSSDGTITGDYTKTGTSLIGGSVFSLSQTDGSIKNPYIYLCENAGGSIDWNQWTSDVQGLEEIDLNQSLTYTYRTWDSTNGVWVDNTQDLIINGLTVLQGKTIERVYLLNSLKSIPIKIEANLNGATLTIVASELAFGELTLVVIADGKKYTTDLTVVTAEISTEEQFVSIFLTDSWHGKTWIYQNVTTEQYAEMTHDGYYVLKNDIVFSDTYYVSKYRSFGVNGTGIPVGVGFNGVLDGKGYTISNLGITNFGDFNYTGGIFGTIGQNGVIRNVAFVNGRMAGSSILSVGAYIANGIAGTLENVFVHVDLAGSTIDKAGQINIFAYGFNNSARLMNCVAYVSGSASVNGCAGVRLCNFVHGGLNTDALTNTYLITDDALTVVGPQTGLIAYNESTVLAGAEFDIQAFTSIWNTVKYKFPVFETAERYMELDKFSAVALGSFTLEVAISNNVATITWNEVANANKYAYRVIVDGVEKVALTEIGDIRQVTFDYSGITVNDYVEIEVTAYNAVGDCIVKSYRHSFHSGTY